jgi:hypothetical protein
LKTPKTGKVTAVVAIMNVLGSKIGNSQNASSGKMLISLING